MNALRLRPLRRLPIAFGWMAKRPLPDDLVDRWLEPLQTQPGARRDLRKYTMSARRGQMLEICERLRAFERPTLVVWTPEAFACAVREFVLETSSSVSESV